MNRSRADKAHGGPDGLPGYGAGLLLAVYMVFSFRSTELTQSV